MSYHGVGAGPGPTKTYKVDMPFPWGKDTEVVVPVQQMVDDTWAALAPHIDELEAKLIQDSEDEMSIYGPVAAKKIIDTVVMPAVNNELEQAVAEFDILKEDAVKALVAVGATIVIAIGVSAWWVKKG